MKINISEISFPSSDGIHTVYGQIYSPVGTEPRGILQIAHGMTDHIERYRALAEALCENGYILAGHCHLGHGKTAVSSDELGFFAERGGADLVVRDMHGMNLLLKEKFPSLPIAVMGHSMGSFISRLYVSEYPNDVKGLIIHATGGPNKVVSLGKLLVGAMSVFKGKRYRSRFIRSLASKGYNSKFAGEDGINAWLTRDKEKANEKLTDPYGSFTFTLSAYNDLFTLVKRSNSDGWFKNYPKDMPTLIVSGDMDPVGGFGRGVRTVYNRLLKNGHGALALKIYEGARHELFNEINKDEIFGDIISWLLEVLS